MHHGLADLAAGRRPRLIVEGRQHERVRLVVRRLRLQSAHAVRPGHASLVSHWIVVSLTGRIVKSVLTFLVLALK